MLKELGGGRGGSATMAATSNRSPQQRGYWGGREGLGEDMKNVNLKIKMKSN